MPGIPACLLLSLHEYEGVHRPVVGRVGRRPVHQDANVGDQTSAGRVGFSSATQGEFWIGLAPMPLDDHLVRFWRWYAPFSVDPIRVPSRHADKELETAGVDSTGGNSSRPMNCVHHHHRPSRTAPNVRRATPGIAACTIRCPPNHCSSHRSGWLSAAGDSSCQSDDSLTPQEIWRNRPARA